MYGEMSPKDYSKKATGIFGHVCGKKDMEHLVLMDKMEGKRDRR